jgi:ophiobolin F synthase
VLSIFTPREFLTDTNLDADVIDENIQDANLDEMEVTLDEGGDTGEFEEKKGASGKAKIAAQILREMMAIDPVRAMVVAKSWAAGVQHSARREEQTNFQTLEEYIPYRSLDVGYM